MQGVRETRTYTATEARSKFSDLVDAAHFGERVMITKRDRRVAIISAEFLERAERLLEIEAALEAEAAQAALEEFQTVGGKTMEQIEDELAKD